MKERIAKALGEAEAQLAESRATDPLAKLTDSEMARAANRREFNREDWERLDLETLASRVRQALGSSDRAELALHHRYGSLAMEERFRMDMRAPSLLKPLLAEAEAKLVNVRVRGRAQETISGLQELTVTMAGESYRERKHARA